ncbi:DUF4238 domain-containing protein [Bordetella genomosp. 9]|uniref:DUF4238 domain-containing protein n=1 Tax=Bordetella genomosp. 9 TaxID=1416803 RepID=UPI0012F7D147|nr:DUF4238 domain-containing protein [Bordetella genomosp. 9]
MSSIQQSHRHHYVPIWYQKGFLAPGKTAFKILDMRPDVFKDDSGKVRGRGRSILCKGPDAHFWEPDLYTIRWLGRTDDVIERMLFGAIDTQGKLAIQAWLAEDYAAIHHSYWQVYEFMDALRLRTPKGLRFVEALTRQKTQLDLMVAMQKLRRMHCLMWAEGCLEIARAPKDSSGFIFSDHPVVLFNRYVFPGDPKLPAGHDPHLHWLGTQTLFPFDRERLYILTHVEYAHSPGPGKARKPRTNSRYFDPNNPMVRYDDCIRTRTFTEQQVKEVNFIIKSRANRYIAGRTEDDLYPERYLKTTVWSKLGQFLLPPRHKVIHQTGYTVMQLKDGSYYFQDQFGRRPRSKAEFDKEVVEAKKMKARIDQILAKHRAEKAEPPLDFDNA